MEVTVHSTLHSVQGRVVVATEPDNTVDSLIAAFCIEKNVPHRRNYVLRNKRLMVLPKERKIQSCDIQNGDILYLGLHDIEDEWCCGCNQWWLIAGIALLIGAVGLAAITAMYIVQQQQLYQHGIVIDGGSSHTQLYLYQWPGEKNNFTAVPRQIFTARKGVDLDSFADNPDGVEPLLESLLNRSVPQVPKGAMDSTPVYLGATAGMRLLNASEKESSDLIMNVTRSTIAQYKFMFDHPMNQSRILTGTEEGSYAWVTVNYLNNVFIKPVPPVVATTSSSSTTFGALDLGGASTQVAFIPDPLKASNKTEYQKLVLFNQSYSVYTHSYLCYGVDEAHRQYQAQLVLDQAGSETIPDPCHPLGHSYTRPYTEVFEAPCTSHLAPINDIVVNATFVFQGQSDPDKCFSSLQNIFNFSAPCDYPPCSFNGVSMPPIHGKYLAFNGFYFPMDFLNATESTTLPQFVKMYEDFCKKNYSEIITMPTNGGNITMYCFEAILSRTLLVEGYKFNTTSWSDISFIQQINGTDLGWSLGYMLNTSYIIPERVPKQRIDDVLFILLVILFGLFLATAVGFACHAKHQKKSRVGSYQHLSSYGAI